MTYILSYMQIFFYPNGAGGGKAEDMIALLMATNLFAGLLFLAAWIKSKLKRKPIDFDSSWGLWLVVIRGVAVLGDVIGLLVWVAYIIKTNFL